VGRHTVLSAPIDKGLRRKFWAIVDPDRHRSSVQGHEFIQQTDYPSAWQGHAHRDLQAFTISFIRSS
jgi:hypothetical protein